MTTCRAFTIWASMAIAVFASSPTRTNAATLSLVGNSNKLCQLTGDIDWAGNVPTAAQTDLHFHLNAVDLGFPVDSGTGPLYFLFGDARPSTTGAPIPPDDALGFTTLKQAPTSTDCLKLSFVTSMPGNFAHPTVQPSILQGSFNVPTGGVFVGEDFYAFFWTDHCVAAKILTPLPETPLKHDLPAGPGAACPEIPLFNSIGRSVIARAAPVGSANFDQIHVGTNPFLKTLATMPNGFVYVTAAQTPPRIIASLNPKPPAVPVFGVARYRASIPYLAMAPHDTFGDPDTWSFYAGTADGQPQWVTHTQWESGHDASGNWTPPAGAELYADNPFDGLDERCVGEHSVTWNATLKTWLLTYVCGPYHVEARTAPHPWGPWSEPTNLLRYVDPNVVCTLIMPVTGAGCTNPTLGNYWPNPNTSAVAPGFFYAPFVMARYTQDVTPAGAQGYRQAKIYWLLSTWNPYQVVVMTSTLKMTD